MFKFLNTSVLLLLLVGILFIISLRQHYQIKELERGRAVTDICVEMTYNLTRDIVTKELPAIKRKLSVIMLRLSNGDEIALCLRAMDESLIKEFKLLRVSQEKQLQALYDVLLIEQRSPGALLDYLDTLNNLRVVETLPHNEGG